MKNKHLLKLNIALTFFLSCMSLFTLAEDDVKVPEVITNEIERTNGGLQKYSDNFYVRLNQYLEQLKGESSENSKNKAMELYSRVLAHRSIDSYTLSHFSEFSDSISKVTDVFIKHFSEPTSSYLLNLTSAVNKVNLLQYYLNTEGTQNESSFLKLEGDAISNLRRKFFKSKLETLNSFTREPGYYEAYGTIDREGVKSYYRSKKVAVESSPKNLQVLFINEVLNKATIQNTPSNAIYDLATVISERFYSLSNAFFDLLEDKINANGNLNKMQLIKDLMEIMLKTPETMRHLDPLKNVLAQSVEANKYIEWSFAFLKGDHFANWLDGLNANIFNAILLKSFNAASTTTLKELFYDQLKNLLLDKAYSVSRADTNPGKYYSFYHREHLFSAMKFLLTQSERKNEQAKNLLADFILNGHQWISISEKYHHYSFNEMFLPNFLSSLKANGEQENELFTLRRAIRVYESSSYANKLLPKLILGFYENRTSDLSEKDFVEPLRWVKESSLSHEEKVQFFNDLAYLFKEKSGSLSTSEQSHKNLVIFKAISDSVKQEQYQISTASRCGKLFL